MIFNPWAILGAVLFAIALAGGGYYEGWQKRGDHEAAVQLEIVNQKNIQIEVERARADGLASELEQEKQNIKTVTVEVIKQVPMVTTIYTERVGDAPLPIPPAVYTVGFMRLWNDALFATSQLPTGAGQPLDISGGADTLRAKIDSPDVLYNHLENAGKWAACRAQLRKLIDVEKGRKPVIINVGP